MCARVGRGGGGGGLKIGVCGGGGNEARMPKSTRRGARGHQ